MESLVIYFLRASEHISLENPRKCFSLQILKYSLKIPDALESTERSYDAFRCLPQSGISEILLLRQCLELYRLTVYRVSWWYNILRVRPIRRVLGGRLKETRGDA